MKCPHCERDGKMLVSQTITRDGIVYRRRGCGRCGKNFTTTETAQPGLPMPKPPRLSTPKPAPIQAAGLTDLTKGWWR